jgi:quercetin dioxygenase-like cupin family protein
MRRTLFSLLAGVVIGVGGLALAQHGHGDAHGKGPVVKVVSSVDIDEEVSGKKSKATTFELTFAPGVGGAPHRHPGPIFGFVLEGEFEFAVGDDKVRTLKAGESFYEAAMALHAVSRNPSDKNPTRVLAVMVHPRDAKELVIPEPAKKK